MKLTKILGVAAVAALALMAFASSASATTLEKNGVTQSSAITIESSLTPGSTLILRDTSGTFANTCTSSTVSGSDSTQTTGTSVSGPISALSFTNCTHSPVVVDEKGSLSVERIGTTTNGTVKSTGAKVTVPVTIFGSIVTATCTTNGTDIGTLTGVGATGGPSEINVHAILNCGSFLPSATWAGTYAITNGNIGVVA
jgi:hypothetical protein